MPKLDPFEVFTFYHLGYDENFRYKFRNLHEAARYFRIAPEQLQAFMLENRIDAETIRHVDFNLSQAHADAQMAEMDGVSVDARRNLARRAFEQYQGAVRDTFDKRKEFDDVNWDDPLGRGV
jgi:hypothetical protein